MTDAPKVDVSESYIEDHIEFLNQGGIDFYKTRDMLRELRRRLAAAEQAQEARELKLITFAQRNVSSGVSAYAGMTTRDILRAFNVRQQTSTVSEEK